MVRLHKSSCYNTRIRLHKSSRYNTRIDTHYQINTLTYICRIIYIIVKFHPDTEQKIVLITQHAPEAGIETTISLTARPMGPPSVCVANK